MRPEEPKEPPLGLAVDVDTRIADVWALVWASTFYQSLEEHLQQDVARIIRGTYLMGYRDALLEVEAGTPGELNHVHKIRLV